MTFENPHYVSATIKLDRKGVDYILNQQDNLDVSNEQILEFSKAFCHGAGLAFEAGEV